ncbi:MAG: hypothetical protein WC043_08725 [Pseudobdellovibrionaceae bacterium]
MNPYKEGLCDVFSGFGLSGGGKFDGWHGDVDAALAPFEESPRPREGTCEGPR